MKILVGIGSYRKNGNTTRVVRMIERQMCRIAIQNNEPIEFETVYLGHQEINACMGCRMCFDREEQACPLKDDLLQIKAKMLAADGFIIATPVYVNDVSGIVKNWIDRLAHVSHRPEFAGKCAYFIATVGDGPTKHALKTLKMAHSTWGYHIVGQAGFKTGALMKEEDLQSRYARSTNRIAEKLYDAITRRRFTRPSFLSLMTFKIQQRYWQREEGDSIDYAYWSRHGWIDPHQEYYFQHRANRLKVACARFTGSVLARFVT